jgi:hypothetical protein
MMSKEPFISWLSGFIRCRPNLLFVMGGDMVSAVFVEFDRLDLIVASLGVGGLLLEGLAMTAICVLSGRSDTAQVSSVIATVVALSTAIGIPDCVVDAPRSAKFVSPAVAESVVTSTDGIDASDVAVTAAAFLDFGRIELNRFDQVRRSLSSAIFGKGERCCDAPCTLWVKIFVGSWELLDECHTKSMN